MAEHDFAQLRAIDFPIWVENSCAELADHFLGYGIFRLEVFVREKIGFDDGAAALVQQSCDRGLSTGDSSGEADGQHAINTLRASAARRGGFGRAQSAAQTRGLHRVAHEHCNREWAHTAGHWR